MQSSHKNPRKEADYPESSSEIIKMRETLDTWIKETGDKGEVPKLQEEKEYWDQQMSLQLKKWMEAKGLTEESTPLQHLEYWKKRLFNE